MIQIELLRKISLDTRHAILNIQPAERPTQLENFPKGACGCSSLLLGAVFAEQGFPDMHYFSGERHSLDRNRWQSHAWIQSQDVIIDITADQFEDAPAGTIFLLSSEWHQQFNAVSNGSADFRKSLSPATIPLVAFLRRLIFPAHRHQPDERTQ